MSCESEFYLQLGIVFVTKTSQRQKNQGKNDTVISSKNVKHATPTQQHDEWSANTLHWREIYSTHFSVERVAAELKPAKIHLHLACMSE